MKRILFTSAIILYFTFSNIVIAQNKDAVVITFSEIEDTIQLYKAYRYLEHLSSIKNSDSVLLFCDSLIIAAKRFDSQLILGDTYSNQAEIYSELNEYYKATQSYKKAIKIFQKLNDKRRLAKVFKNLYFLEYYRDNLTEAAEYLLESKTFYEQINDFEGISKVNNYLGDLYAKLDKFELAETYYKKSIKLKDSAKNLKGVGLYMNNLSYLYINHKMPFKAKNIVQDALKINKEDSLPVYTVYSYYILAKIALHQKEYKKSIKYYDTVLNLGNSTKHFALTIPLIISKQQKALIAFETKQYKQAEKLLNVARNEFMALDDIDPTSHLLANYEIASRLDSAKGDLSGALAWQKKYQQLSDEKIRKISSEKIERAEDRHQAEIEHLKMIDDQEQKDRKNNARLFRYKTFAFIILSVSIIILLFLLYIIRTRRDRKRLIYKLNESNQIKNKLFSIISHDLKNEIHGLEGSLNLMKDDEIPLEEFKTLIPLLANRTHRTSIMLNNLLNWSKSQLKALKANPVSFDVTEVIEDKFTFFRAKATQKNINLINKLTPTKVYADKDMFSIVAQNLIANAVKFCDSGDSISLWAVEKEDSYEICFEDTGIGINPDNFSKLFSENTFTTKGTQNETGTGLGLKICKELVELNGGEIKIKSTLGEGSMFCVFLPKTKS